MKKIIFFSLLLFSLGNCKAQNEVKRDSLAIISRGKADIILSHFDTIHSTKILYSFLDKDYYVIIQENNGYKEYYISTDSLNNILIFNEINKKGYKGNKRKILKRIKEDNNTINKAFNLENYHNGLITLVPNATYINGQPSYFVVIDKSGRRYGEYSLSAMTSPPPIDPNLWIYLLRELSTQMK